MCCWPPGARGRSTRSRCAPPRWIWSASSWSSAFRPRWPPSSWPRPECCRRAWGAAPASNIALFAVLQGVGTGILSTLSYAYAVRRLGSSIPAVTGAISPVLTTLLAVPLFGEPITVGISTALALIVGGVITFNLAASPVRNAVVR
ncbi:EamA family transporter [Actinoplanes sp. NBC_00393]|uniref:EamA family transporter n=1 Tax=Actinoplanes sp. NBC_00393 TaxID=2975953 RepID=UPI003FA4991B